MKYRENRRTGDKISEIGMRSLRKSLITVSSELLHRRKQAVSVYIAITVSLVRQE